MSPQLRVLLLLTLLGGCPSEPLLLHARQEGPGVLIETSEPIVTAAAWNDAGVPWARRDLDAGLRTVQLVGATTPQRTLLVRVGTADGRSAETTVEVVDRSGPVDLRLEAPAGQAGVPLVAGGTYPLTLGKGAHARVAIQLVAREPLDLRIRIGLEEARVQLSVQGEQATVVLPIPDTSPVRLEVERLGGMPWSVHATLDVARLPFDRLHELVSLERITFPCTEDGEPDPSRPDDRIGLPSPLWDRLLRGSRLGGRGRSAELPWGAVATTLAAGDLNLHLVVRQRMLDEAGRPAPAFRPRLRGADDGSGQTSVVLRVPERGTARAVLPLFVDETLLPPGRSRWTLEHTVWALGTEEPLLRSTRTVVVSRGSDLVQVGFVLTAAVGLLGFAFAARRWPRWLAERSTTELVTIALFGSLRFAVATVSQFGSLLLSAVLGPLAPLVTGLVDDTLRACIIATLVTLLPRSGVGALSAILATLIGWLALGGMSAVDIVFIGSHAVWLEGGLWLAGITRHRRWMEGGPGARWRALCVALVPAACASAATGLCLHVVLYRLFFAPWYVVAVLLLQGVVYVVIGCRLAVGLADGLREVAP